MSKSFSIFFFSSIFILFLISGYDWENSFASIDDGILSKYTSDGSYKVEMKWSPSGLIMPNVDSLFVFEIKDALTDTVLEKNSFDLDIIQNGKILKNYSKEFDSNSFSKVLTFTESGFANIVLSNINNSGKDVKFTMKINSNENFSMNDDGFTSKKLKVGGNPVIFACGFEKNVITLYDCYQTQTYDNYGWFGKVNFLIYAPGWNENPNKVESIGGTEADKITISSRSDNHPYQELGRCNGFDETGPNTGLFVGRVKLSGHDHDVNGDGTLDTKFGSTKCGNSPIDEYGKIEVGRTGAVTLTWQYQDDPVKVVSQSITWGWNLGELNFSQDQYHIDDKVEFTFYDRDMYSVAENTFDLNFRVYSDTDMVGVLIQPGENYKFKKPFSFTLNTEKTVGKSLRVSNGDTIYVQYDDCTMPKADDKFGFTYSDNHCVEVIEKATVYVY